MVIECCEHCENHSAVAFPWQARLEPVFRFMFSSRLGDAVESLLGTQELTVHPSQVSPRRMPPPLELLSSALPSFSRSLP